LNITLPDNRTFNITVFSKVFSDMCSKEFNRVLKHILIEDGISSGDKGKLEERR